MITIIITRFSILDHSYPAFRCTKKKISEEQYKSELFNEKRLEFKFTVFEMVTLPSILNQTNQNYIWYIYSSEYLPEKYKKRLISITENYEKIKCIFIKSFNDFNQFVIPYTNYCSIRLDDDDGLCPIFIENVNKYKEKKNTIISYPCGKSFTINNNKIIYGKNIYLKNNAQGLCAINMNIHRCGNHIIIHKKFPVIYDETPNMYYVCCSEFCDTKRPFKI